MKLSKTSLEKTEEFKKEIIALVNEPILQRIIGAYAFPDPVKNMETELHKILQEVLHEEN